jgi:Tfp pilus assembly protein PilF
MDSAAQGSKLARLRPIAPYVVIGLAVALTFGGAASHAFLLWDDDQHVSANARLDPPSWSELERFWTAPYSGMYVPVSYTWYTFLAWSSRVLLGGALDPRVFHLGNLALHAACACLAFKLLARCVQSELAALAGALVFALHPLQVESVAWISEARGLLAAAFGLLALDRHAASSAPAHARRDYAIATLCFALALLAKPSAVSIVLAAAVLDRWVLGTRLARSAARLAPWLALALAAVALTKIEQANEVLAFVTPFATRPLVALDALAFYLDKLLVPFDLVPDYGRTPQRVLAIARVPVAWIVAVLAIAGVVLVTARVAKSQRKLPVAACALFVAGLAPVLGLVPFAYQDISTVADRYAYLALLGPALFTAWIAARGATWRVAMFALALAAGLESRRQTAIWSDTETLFERTLQVNPQSAVAESDIALSLSMRGENTRAIEHYERAIAIDPRQSIAHNNLGMLLFQRGDVDGSIAHFRAAIEARPSYARAHANLGVALQKRGDLAAAEAEEREALRLQPENVEAHTSLGNLLLGRGDAAGALAQYEAALALHPSDADAHKNAAFVLAAQGRGKLAAEHYRAALRARPGWSEAEIELAWLLATHRNPDVRDGREAVALAEHQARSVRALDVLAAAYAEVGRFQEAERTARDALELARATDPGLVPAIEARRASYAAHQAYRAPAPRGPER